jgi:hypothetical protein
LHCAVEEVGMWFDGQMFFAKSPTPKPWWQLEQSRPSGDVAVGWIGSCARVGRSTITTPYQFMPVSWQVWQSLVMPTWFIDVPPNVLKLVGEWHVSQGREDGTWSAGLPGAWTLS